MKISKTIAVFAAIASAAVTTSHASAALNGTNMNVGVTHAGAFSALSAVSGVMTYGTPAAFLAPGWGTLSLTSPAAPPPPGFDNSIKLDFTAFGYQAFAAPGFATVGTVKITNLAEAFDLSSVKILINGVDKTVTKSLSGNGFQASWNTADVLSANPATPNVVLAWNSAVPAPGALALLGAAGVVGARRRRR